MRKELAAGVLLTIFGFVIAIGATWWTARDLANREADREKEEAQATVEGVALVLQGLLASGDGRFVNSLADCKYRLYNPETTIPFEDRKRLAARMSPKSWEQVERGMESYRLQYTRSLEEHAFVSYDIVQIRDARERMYQAQKMLAPLAGLGARKQRPEVLGDACDDFGV